MRKIGIALLLATCVFAQKKPITMETLNQAGRGGGGRGGFGAATWAPDGKTFLTRQGRNLVIYDAATQKTRELVSTEAIDAAAVRPPAEDGPTDWQNRRARTGGTQWSADGKSILYTSGGDVFLIAVESGKWEQITRTPAVEVDPKLSPDGKAVAFRRGFDLYVVDVASKKET